MATGGTNLSYFGRVPHGLRKGIAPRGCESDGRGFEARREHDGDPVPGTRMRCPVCSRSMRIRDDSRKASQVPDLQEMLNGGIGGLFDVAIPTLPLVPEGHACAAGARELYP